MRAGCKSFMKTRALPRCRHHWKARGASGSRRSSPNPPMALAQRGSRSAVPASSCPSRSSRTSRDWLRRPLRSARQDCEVSRPIGRSSVTLFAVDDARGPAFSPPGREISSSATGFLSGSVQPEHVLAVARVSRKSLFCPVNQMRVTANSRAERGALLQPPLADGSIALVSGNWSKSDMR